MTTQTLTDRYVYAVQRSLPEKQRDDIDRELRGTIADTIDGKVESGVAADKAERETIAELGDPYRLAAGYADRPLHLIGPKVFPDYIRLLKVLYVIVLPIVFAALLLAQLLGHHPNGFWGAFGSTIGAIISVAAHFGFWTTLVFALIERSPDYKATTWSPDTLPQVPAKGAIKLSDTVASGVWFVLWVGALIWAQFVWQPAVFDPALGWGWLAFFLGLAVVEIVFRVVLYRVGHWTFPQAIVNLLRDLAGTIPIVILLTTGRLMNPAFLDEYGIGSVFAPGGVVTIVGLVVIVVAVSGSTADAFSKAWKARRLRVA